jgi:polar amino acid transport system substrate-binding protein
MVIRQAMGTAKAASQQAADHVAAFVEAMKASGFVAQALQRHGLDGVTVAPAA